MHSEFVKTLKDGNKLWSRLARSGSYFVGKPNQDPNDNSEKDVSGYWWMTLSVCSSPEEAELKYETSIIR